MKSDKRKVIPLGDLLLAKFASMPRSTANEVGIDGLQLDGVRLSSAQKRANDLVKRGFISQTDRRECHKSGKLAMEFMITVHGLEHLRANGIKFSVARGSEAWASIDQAVSIPDPVVQQASVKSRFSDMRGKLS